MPYEVEWWLQIVYSDGIKANPREFRLIVVNGCRHHSSHIFHSYFLFHFSAVFYILVIFSRELLCYTYEHYFFHRFNSNFLFSLYFLKKKTVSFVSDVMFTQIKKKKTRTRTRTKKKLHTRKNLESRKRQSFMLLCELFSVRQCFQYLFFFFSSQQKNTINTYMY